MSVFRCFRRAPRPPSDASVVVHDDDVTVETLPSTAAPVERLEARVRELERLVVERPAYLYVVVLTAPFQEIGVWEERAHEARMYEDTSDVLFLTSCDSTPRLTVYAQGRGAILRTELSEESWIVATHVVRMSLPEAEDFIEVYLDRTSPPEGRGRPA